MRTLRVPRGTALMPAWMDGWPWLAVYLFFLSGAIMRSQALYWLGRGVATGVLRTRWGERLDAPQVHRAVATIERWGMPVVPLAFLTVGFQSAVFSAAGLVRVHWLRFTLWSVPGALAWAAVWGGGGLAALAGVLALARANPLLAVAVVLTLAAVAAAAVLRARRRREDRAAGERLAHAGHEPADGS